MAAVKKIEIVDDDGDVVPPPTADTDVAQLIYLLEYCRKREFLIGPTVQVGSVVVQVQDPGLRKRLGKEDDPGIWAMHGHKDE